MRLAVQLVVGLRRMLVHRSRMTFLPPGCRNQDRRGFPSVPATNGAIRGGSRWSPGGAIGQAGDGWYLIDREHHGRAGSATPVDHPCQLGCCVPTPRPQGTRLTPPPKCPTACRCPAMMPEGQESGQGKCPGCARDCRGWQPCRLSPDGNAVPSVRGCRRASIGYTGGVFWVGTIARLVAGTPMVLAIVCQVEGQLAPSAGPGSPQSRLHAVDARGGGGWWSQATDRGSVGHCVPGAFLANEAPDESSSGVAHSDQRPRTVAHPGFFSGCAKDRRFGARPRTPAHPGARWGALTWASQHRLGLAPGGSRATPLLRPPNKGTLNWG